MDEIDVGPGNNGEWLDWGMSPPPYAQESVRVWRHGWAFPQTINRSQMHPSMNIAGLWWHAGPGANDLAARVLYQTAAASTYNNQIWAASRDQSLADRCFPNPNPLASRLTP